MIRSSRSARLILLLALFMLPQTGCIFIRSAHIDGDAVAAPHCELPQPIQISATFTFQRNGAPVPAVAEAYRGNVLIALNETAMFSNVDFAAKRDINIDVVANNEAAIGAAVGRGIVSGLTFGLIGYKVSDYYDFIMTLTMTGQMPQTVQFRREIVSTSGIIHGSVDDSFREVPDANDGFNRHLIETIHAAIGEWKTQGLLCNADSEAARLRTDKKHELKALVRIVRWLRDAA